MSSLLSRLPFLSPSIESKTAWIRSFKAASVISASSVSPARSCMVVDRVRRYVVGQSSEVGDANVVVVDGRWTLGGGQRLVGGTVYQLVQIGCHQGPERN